MNTNDFKKGVYIRFKNSVWQVIDFQHVFPGKGNAFVKTKLKNMETAKVLENTFKAGENVANANVETTDAQFMYKDGKTYVFMDNTTYEQFELSEDEIKDLVKYLIDGQKVLIIKENDIPLNISLPKKIQLKVVEAPPGVKGDSAGGATKQVKLETSIFISVPLFIKEGDVLVINTESGEYVERA